MANIHIFKPGDEIPQVTPIDWDVEIYGRPYYVAHFPGCVHSIGGHWGDNDLWAWPRDEKPRYENLIEFEGVGGALWGVTYEPGRYTKTKWGECRIYESHNVTITRNGKPFYSFYGTLHRGLAKAQTLIDEISECPLELNAIDYESKIVGRKVWWRSEPAIITRWVGDGQACVILEPDVIEKFTVPPEFTKENPDYYCDGYVKTSIFDKHIWWWET